MYLFNVLNSEMMRNAIRYDSTGSNINNLSSALGNIKIQLPPLDVQEQITAECIAVDNEYNAAQETIQAAKNNIQGIFEQNTAIQGGVIKLGQICSINNYTINPQLTPEKEYTYIDIDAVEGGTGLFTTDKKIIGKTAPSRARRLAKAKSTIISTVRPNLRAFIYIENEINDAIYSTGFAILESNDKNILIDKYLYYCFMHSDELMRQMIAAMPKGSYPSINTQDIQNFEIQVPSLTAQQQLIAQVEQYEASIRQAQTIMDGCAARKKAILDKYLN